MVPVPAKTPGLANAARMIASVKVIRPTRRCAKGAGRVFEAKRGAGANTPLMGLLVALIQYVRPLMRATVVVPVLMVSVLIVYPAGLVMLARLASVIFFRA